MTALAKKVAWGVALLWATAGTSAASDNTSSASRDEVRTFVVVYARNATTILYINGREVPWHDTERSLKTPHGASAVKYSTAVCVNEADNVFGIAATADGDNPGVRIEASRRETDARWKVGTPGDDDWLKMSYDDSVWSAAVPKARSYSWGSQENVNDPASYAWVTDAAARKACFRQVIRGVEKADQHVKYTACDWGRVLDGLGYHRAIVRVSGDAGRPSDFVGTYEQRAPNANAVWAHIPWRRRDVNPEQKAIFIHDSKTGKRVENFEIIRLNQECLDVVFEPPTVPGEYEVYYLPYFERYNRPGYWMTTEQYVKPYCLCDENWLSRASWRVGNPNAVTPRIADGNWQRLPRAELVEMQSRTEFDSFYPMEVPATKEEVAEIVAKNGGRDYLVFPEDRKFPVRMFETIPLRWAKTGPTSEFAGAAQPGEYYCFQIGVFAANRDVKNVTVDYSGLKNEQGDVIPASQFRCINTGGLDVLGKPFKKTFNMLKGKVRPLWIGFQAPDHGKGTYKGTVVVKPEGMAPTPVKVSVRVAGELIANKGDDEPWRHSRLRWLDSTLGLDDDELVPPYTPLKVSGNRMECLNRAVVFGLAGMPQTITSNGKDVLAAPMTFDVIIDGKPVAWRSSGSDRIVLAKPAKIIREVTAESGLLQLTNRTTMEADGMVRFDIAIRSEEDVAVDAIVVTAPYRAQAAKYLTGGPIAFGGFRPEKIDWKAKYNTKVWMGDHDAGMQTHFFDRTNGSVVEDHGMAVLKAETGRRAITKGKDLVYSFRLFITPFKPINNKLHWSTRTIRFTRATDIGSLSYMKTPDNAQWGAVVHTHHGTPENPWINYPYLTWNKLAGIQKDIIAKGGCGINLYYTAQAISDRAVELWALRSLGAEVLSGVDVYGASANRLPCIDVYNASECPERSVGHPWLREHLVNGFARRWACPMAPGVVDQSINSPTLSRWYNYYVEGLNWLIRKNCLCSLYLDGIYFDREIMKRVARSLSKVNPEYRIEFHGSGGYGKKPVSAVSDRMEHFPYLTKLWFGEFVNYNLPPDYWLVEISGIPFGVTSEMLDNTRTANPWRGMIYGMNDRTNAQWAGPLYKLWDDFGIQDAEWLGYWNPKCSVRTGRSDIMATVYKKDGKSLICLASWAREDVDVSLAVDWSALALDPSKTTLTAPAIENIQSARVYHVGDRLPIRKAQGLILIAAQGKM